MENNNIIKQITNAINDTGKTFSEEDIKKEFNKQPFKCIDEIEYEKLVNETHITFAKISENDNDKLSKKYISVSDNGYSDDKLIKNFGQETFDTNNPIYVLKDNISYIAIIKIFDNENLDLTHLKSFLFLRAKIVGLNKDAICENIKNCVESYNTAHKQIVQIGKALKTDMSDECFVHDDLKELEEFIIVIPENAGTTAFFYNKYRLEDMEIEWLEKRSITENHVLFNKTSFNVKDRTLKRFVFLFQPYYTKDNNKKKYFKEKAERFLSNNYLWIYEPHTKEHNTTSSITDAALEEYLKSVGDENIIRLRSGYEDRGYSVIVKVKNNKDELDLSHLKDYLVSTNSRMFKDVKLVELCTSKSTDTDAKNVLVFGAPGTGKSRWVDDTIKNHIAEPIVPDKTFDDDEAEKYKEDREKKIKDEIKQYVTRVTFYEDYSYENFVGCYKPVSTEDNGKKVITYEFRPGPFTNVYINAMQDTTHNYYLVIEEINRARAASVFGDMFQLLDRDGSGVSEYDIVPDTELEKYLREELKDKFDDRMKLPSNMYIYATMNSADQGVYPLDSAFKRRWSFVYKSVNDVEEDENDPRAIKVKIKDKVSKNDEFKSIKWNDLRTMINTRLEDCGVEEDRLIGYWFFKDEEIDQINKYIDGNTKEQLPNPMADKLYSYLLQDVMRMNPEKIFTKGFLTMSKLRDSVRNNAIDEVFNFDIDCEPIAQNSKKTDESDAAEVPDTENPETESE